MDETVGKAVLLILFFISPGDGKYVEGQLNDPVQVSQSIDCQVTIRFMMAIRSAMDFSSSILLLVDGRQIHLRRRVRFGRLHSNCLVHETSC